MTKKKTSEASNITVTAVRLILKKRKAAMSLDSINNALKKANMKPVTAEMLDKNFRHICTSSGQKWLLGGTSAAKPTAKKSECDKKPKACGNKAKCAPESQCNKAFCSIKMSGNFQIAEYNQRASLHNAIVNMPTALESPEDFVFFVGVGDWPEEYKGVEILCDQGASGVLLCPRKYVREIKV